MQSAREIREGFVDGVALGLALVRYACCLQAELERFLLFSFLGGMDGDRQGPGGLMEQLGEIKQGGSPPPKGSPPHPRREPGATASVSGVSFWG